MRVALYARVSDIRKAQDTSNQLRQLRAFVEKQGWKIHREFIDHKSAKTSDRAEFQSMMEAASRREFDLVLFWSLDRLSREGVLATLLHLQKLTSYGVEWKSYTEQYLDSCGVFKDAVLSILATIAKQERTRISERVIAGMERARANGAVFGRRRLVLDYGRLAQLHADGLSMRGIAAQLGVSPAFVCRALKATRRMPSPAFA